MDLSARSEEALRASVALRDAVAEGEWTPVALERAIGAAETLTHALGLLGPAAAAELESARGALERLAVMLMRAAAVSWAAESTPYPAPRLPRSSDPSLWARVDEQVVAALRAGAHAEPGTPEGIEAAEFAALPAVEKVAAIERREMPVR